MMIFEAEQVLAQLPMKTCIGVMADAIRDLADGRSSQPLRTLSQLPDGNIFGFMPAYLGAGDYFGAKIATVFHTNAGTGYPTHMGYVMLLEANHGSVCAMADASAVTQLRTGAVSGVATNLLARQDAHTLALIGSGAQAWSHLEAMCCVRDIHEVSVFDVDPVRATHFAAKAGERFRIPVRAATSVTDATVNADIICTVTNAKTPILTLAQVKPGAHINAVGAYSKTTREIASDLVAASRLYADRMDSILSEGGEFLIPKSEGLLDESHIVGDLGGLLQGRTPARTGEAQISLFDAHGLAVEDVACVKWLYQHAT
ncbi:MAG TPA: hypothetical protein PLP25_02085 [Candidatus Limiplasma sp.]|nr:hypothetical protein [Candidatus Limiplasma sp.]HPS80636.1 hypothetical protein [Candidatus Limiplasma sp.]